MEHSPALKIPRRESRGSIVNALSIDVEDYFHASALTGAFGDRAWGDLPSRVRRNTHRLLDLFDDCGTRATFFVLGWVAERDPGLVRDIHARGHELACHGLTHKLVFDQTPKEFREETRRAKQLIEDAAGTAVNGYRAASFSITRRSLWALDVLADCGFSYDSSIFPVHHDRYGVPGAARAPHRLALPTGATLIEFPPSTIRVAGLTLPAGGGGYFRLLPYAYTRFSLRQLNDREREPLMFYLHPWEIDEDQPVGDVKWLTRIRHYRNLGACESRLRRLLGERPFAPIRDVLDSHPPLATIQLPWIPAHWEHRQSA